MSGPIVRTGTTPKFWENWDRAFGKNTAGKKKPASGAKKTTAKAAAKKKSTKKKAKK